ncbi:MAG: ABC transporter substrate-binding protein [Sutterellaceae bacterium]|nr:ABC transporter substrate-binding protein [Sutterellaceae bacterium]
MLTRRELMEIAGSLVLASVTPWAMAAADATGDPDQWILEISNNILNAIKTDTALASGDAQKVKKFVDELVMPVVDFERMTRTAVGPKWRQATKEQRAELQTLFREQLTRVYSGALSTVKDQGVKLAPNRVKPTATDALVRTLLTTPGKPDVRVNYRLKKVSGSWRIVDVDVEGIWLVENYRTQFAGVVNQSGIEGLIKTMREKLTEPVEGTPNVGQ